MDGITLPALVCMKMEGYPCIISEHLREIIKESGRGPDNYDVAKSRVAEILTGTGCDDSVMHASDPVSP